MKANKLIILTVVVISVVLIGLGATSATLASSNQPTRGLIQGKEEAAGMTWNLAHDFRVSPNQANPNPDSYGNAETWSFMRSTVAHHLSTYSLLTVFITNVVNIPGLQGWLGPEPTGFPNDGLPTVQMNTTGQPIVFGPGAVHPPGVIITHPDSTQPAIVGWHSPFAGSIAIVGGVTDLNSSNGDGILWYIDKNSSTVASGAYPNGGAQLFKDSAQGSQLGNIAVKKGDFIYFLVAPGGDYYSDATQLDVTITMVSLSTTPTATFTPDGPWIFCAFENQRCSFPGTQQVRFGEGGNYVIKTFTGGVQCNIANFGDPAVGKGKMCHYTNAVLTATPTSTPTQTPTFTPTLTPTRTPTATCPAVPNQPKLLAPPNGSASGKAQVLLSWSGDPCAVQYKVKVKLETKTGPTVQKGTTPLTEFRTKALAPATYYWKVSACNAFSCTGSKWWQFTVK